MGINKRILALFTVFIAAIVVSSGLTQQKVKQLFPKGATVYGTNTDGCLVKGSLFNLQNYVSFKPAFNTPYRYAHSKMAGFLSDLDSEYKKTFNDFSKNQILLGEISKEGGGVILPHFSHQIGLDIDFYFLNNNPQNSKWPYDYVVTGKGVSEEFDIERNWWLAGFMALDKRTNRIFVAPEIKHAFCINKDKLKYWKDKKDSVLRKLRPWYGHRTHFHLRLNCPEGETGCFQKGKEIGSDDGCVEAVSWFKDKGYDKIRPRLDYSKKGKFNVKCWQEKPNKIAYPGIEEYLNKKAKK